MDAATIALSGGTALATKVHWVRRGWAMAEVAGAVGNIAVNTAAVSPEIQPAIEAYNAVMGIIGIKHLTQGGIKYLENLPASIQNALKENKGFRELITANLDKIKTSYNNYLNLSDEQRKTYDKAYHGKRLLNKFLGIKETLPERSIAWKQGWNAESGVSTFVVTK